MTNPCHGLAYLDEDEEGWEALRAHDMGELEAMEADAEDQDSDG